MRTIDQRVAGQWEEEKYFRLPGTRCRRNGAGAAIGSYLGERLPRCAVGGADALPELPRSRQPLSLRKLQNHGLSGPTVIQAQYTLVLRVCACYLILTTKCDGHPIALLLQGRLLSVHLILKATLHDSCLGILELVGEGVVKHMQIYVKWLLIILSALRFFKRVYCSCGKNLEKHCKKVIIKRVNRR